MADAQEVSAVTDVILRLMAGPADSMSGDIIVVRDGQVTLAGRL
jgi:hypothetical protein